MSDVFFTRFQGIRGTLLIVARLIMLASLEKRERERKETRMAIVTIEIISTRENSFGKLFQFARSLRERDPAFLPHSFENRG